MKNRFRIRHRGGGGIEGFQLKIRFTSVLDKEGLIHEGFSPPSEKNWYLLRQIDYLEIR